MGGARSPPWAETTIGLRRAYHRRFGHHARFHVAVLATIVVVAWVVVPRVSRVLSGLSGYNPGGYEPKDFARQDWLAERGHPVPFVPLSWDALVTIALVVVVVMAWIAV